MRNATILSTGSYAPEREVPNSYFNELLGEDVDTWLRENVQIRSRRWCEPHQATTDLCYEAATQALARGSINAEALDLIIVATDTPEYVSPSTASKLQHLLGAKHAGTFDLNTACAGFVTALDVASKYIRADEQYNHVLVIGAYAMSKYLNMEDKKTVTLFADGAGAVILKAEETTDDKTTAQGFLTSQLISQGQYHDWMGIYAGGARMPVDSQVVTQKEHLLKFVKKFPKELNPEVWSQMARTMAERIGVEIGEVNRFFVTQININSIFETMDLLGQPHDKAQTIMHDYGYTGSACIPMAFDQAVTEGKVQRGDLLFFIGSGGGLAFASAAFRY